MSNSLRVEVIKLGYFGLKLRYPGERLLLPDEKSFSSKWMKKLPSANPIIPSGLPALPEPPPPPPGIPGPEVDKFRVSS